MNTFDEMYNEIAFFNKWLAVSELSLDERSRHYAALTEIRQALMEYASLHLIMAPRILRRGYIEAKGD